MAVDDDSFLYLERAAAAAAATQVTLLSRYM